METIWLYCMFSEFVSNSQMVNTDTAVVFQRWKKELAKNREKLLGEKEKEKDKDKKLLDKDKKSTDKDKKLTDKDKDKEEKKDKKEVCIQRQLFHRFTILA